MAIVQYTAIVNQIRGKLNGSVFNKSKNAYTLQRKQQPKRTASQLQTRRRAGFSAVQRAWKTTSITQRHNAQAAATANPTVDRFGNEVILSAYNHWIKTNLIRRVIGLPTLLALTPTSANGVVINDLSAYVQITYYTNRATEIFADWVGVSQTVTTQDLYVLMYVSIGVSNGVQEYSGQWYFLGSSFEPAPRPIGTYFQIAVEEEIPERYIAPVEEQVMFVRIDFWQVDIGAKVHSVVQRITPVIHRSPF